MAVIEIDREKKTFGNFKSDLENFIRFTSRSIVQVTRWKTR